MKQKLRLPAVGIIVVIIVLVAACSGDYEPILPLGPCTTLDCNCVYWAGECICETGGFYCGQTEQSFCPAVPGFFCTCFSYVCIVGGDHDCDDGDCVTETVDTCNCTAGDNCAPVVGGECENPGCVCALLFACICGPAYLCLCEDCDCGPWPGCPPNCKCGEILFNPNIAGAVMPACCG